MLCCFQKHEGFRVDVCVVDVAEADGDLELVGIVAGLEAVVVVSVLALCDEADLAEQVARILVDLVDER